ATLQPQWLSVGRETLSGVDCPQSDSARPVRSCSVPHKPLADNTTKERSYKSHEPDSRDEAPHPSRDDYGRSRFHLLNAFPSGSHEVLPSVLLSRGGRNVDPTTDIALCVPRSRSLAGIREGNERACWSGWPGAAYGRRDRGTRSGLPDSP